MESQAQYPSSPAEVIEIETAWIPLSDGCRLAARIWLPAYAEERPVGAVMEYIPYRRRDLSRTRDEPMHRYFAEHGYASLRVDLRGSGDSSGLLEDEYTRQEWEDGVEAIARTLLRRYGVVFRSLLAREAFAVPWRDLLREMRRLEARGDIRGGRFVAGFTGEQYALPEAVETLRRVRRAPADGAIVTLSAADPLNLTGIVCLGDRVPATASARIAFRDGVPIGTLTGGRKIDWIEPQAPEQEWSARNALLRRRIPALPAQRPG